MTRLKRTFGPPLSRPTDDHALSPELDAILKRELARREREIENRIRALRAEVALIMREELPRV